MCVCVYVCVCVEGGGVVCVCVCMPKTRKHFKSLAEHVRPSACTVKIRSYVKHNTEGTLWMCHVKLVRMYSQPLSHNLPESI